MKNALLALFVAAAPLMLGACGLVDLDLASSDAERREAVTGRAAYAPGELVDFTVRAGSAAMEVSACGGINYTIEQKTRRAWTEVGGYYGPCNAMGLPWIRVEKGEELEGVASVEGAGTFRLGILYHDGAEDRKLYTNAFTIR